MIPTHLSAMEVGKRRVPDGIAALSALVISPPAPEWA